MCRCSTSTCWCCGKWTRSPTGSPRNWKTPAIRPSSPPAQETDWNYKRASYGRLSTRHLGVEAGLGTLGLEVNILTPEFGPRVYLTGILTELELAAGPAADRAGLHRRILQPLPACLSRATPCCISASTSAPAPPRRRNSASPPSCNSSSASSTRRRRRKAADGALARRFGFWQGLLRVVGSFGDCPRCLAVCPVGNDYHAHLADVQKAIPEKTPEKVALGKRYRENRAQGADIAGLNDWNRRWVGPEGYKGMVARQLQEFKKRSSSAARTLGRRRRERAELEMVSAFKQPLTAADDQGEGPRARRRSRRHRRRRDAGTPSARPARSAASVRHHRSRRRPRHRAGQARQPRRRPHRRLERSSQILQRRTGALAPRGSLARAGLLARRQRLSGDHRAADPCRSLALRRRSAAGT